MGVQNVRTATTPGKTAVMETAEPMIIVAIQCHFAPPFSAKNATVTAMMIASTHWIAPPTVAVTKFALATAYAHVTGFN